MTQEVTLGSPALPKEPIVGEWWRSQDRRDKNRTVEIVGVWGRKVGYRNIETTRLAYSESRSFKHRFVKIDEARPKMADNKHAVGLYRKFEVRRTDGTDAPGLKHDGCRYFVLDLDHDPFADEAIRVYALQCQREYPALAEDITTLRLAKMHGEPQPPSPPMASD